MTKDMEIALAHEKSQPLSRAQRAAVIISVLEEDVAKRMLQPLIGTDLERMEGIIASVPTIPKGELDKIVKEFLTELQEVAGGIVGGRSLLEKFRHSVLEDVGSPITDTEIPDFTIASGMESSTWTRLQELDPDQVAEYLNTLPPNVIASVLRRVEPAYSAQLISKLDEPRTGVTLVELLKNMRGEPELDAVVEKMVEADLIAAIEASDAEDSEEHFGRIGEVMSLLPQAKRDNLLRFLREGHEKELDLVQRQVLDVAKLPEILPAKYVPVLTREFEETELLELLAVFKSAYPEVFDFLISNISSRVAENIKSEIDRMPELQSMEPDDVVNAFTMRLLDLRKNRVIELAA